MTEHTPGPWRVVLGRFKPDAPVFGFSIEAVGKVPPVASAGVAIPNHILVTPDISTGYTPVEVEANARLIAAAPDLLRACRALVKAVDEVASPWPMDLVNARAAIAKALGQSNV